MAPLGLPGGSPGAPPWDPPLGGLGGPPLVGVVTPVVTSSDSTGPLWGPRQVVTNLRDLKLEAPFLGPGAYPDAP